MDKIKFFNELKDLLEIEDANFNEDSELSLTSIAILSIVVFVDENFDKQIKGSELKGINKVEDLMVLIGIENFK
jgi:acyl carrier protein